MIATKPNDVISASEALDFVRDDVEGQMGQR